MRRIEHNAAAPLGRFKDFERRIEFVFCLRHGSVAGLVAGGGRRTKRPDSP
jgi:hypothetical protein